ncbi:MAG: hypothetical protein PEGG_00648 [Paraeggerthella hongkongensis]|uniref:esterase/lipase family protein n=1 Tax=Paraeggerthella hominis TaxID=2897351 RepID=UPI001C12651A|nr:MULTISPECIES: hypothetical protein [Paraeggerthella]MBU5405840.1 hypothetical protein [Paraeggerthella hongkongensis]MCD2433687.1 hypothetical protein [Paraeggerthella hominis]
MTDLSTSYPFVYLHGILAHDRSAIESNLWGRIPQEIRRRGGIAMFGNQDSLGSVQSNVYQLERTLDMAFKLTEAPKVHIIAHSKGGLDARCLAHRPSMRGRIASITTFATPHGGLRTADHFLGMSSSCLERIASPINWKATKNGDMYADCIGVLHDLSTEGAARFNEAYPDLPDIAYRTFGVVEQPRHRSPKGAWMHWMVKRYDGENDGLVPASSTKRDPWQELRVPEGEPGLNHNDVIDQRKRDTPIITGDGRTWSSIVEFHMSLAEDLAAIR